MNPCPQCQSPLTPAQAFCAQCGTQVKKVCFVCQAASDMESPFCGRCGTAIGEGDAPPMQCAHCGARVYVGHAYCPECGMKRMPSCASCGALLSPQWSYCPMCGRLLGESELAYAAIGRAAENEAIACNDRGVELLEEEDYEEAIEAFQRAIALAPEESLYHYNLGVAYEGLGRDGEAFESYQRAIKLDAHNASAYLALGHLYHARGQRAEAEKCWHAVIGLAPDSDEAAEAKELLTGKAEEER